MSIGYIVDSATKAFVFGGVSYSNDYEERQVTVAIIPTR
jgi:hypothetical protein